MKIVESSILLATGVIDPVYVHAHERDEAGAPPPISHICPTGQHWDDSKQACVPDVVPVPNPLPLNWLSLNNRIASTNFFGYNPSVGGMAFQAAGGQTYYFLIDPFLAAGMTPPGKPMLAVADIAQTLDPNATLYRLHTDNSLGQMVPMVAGNSQWPKTDPWAGERLLLKIAPQGSCQMLVYWFPS